MVAVAAGRRPGAGAGGGRRRAGCGGGQGQQQQAQQQRLLAVAVAARFAEARPASVEAAVSPYGGGGGGCCVEFLECLLGALGVSANAVTTAPVQYRWAVRSIRRRRRGGSSSPRGASAEGRRAEPPGRIAGNGASASAVASLYTMQGRKGVNQDAMVVWENFGSKDDTIFCGVFDGHGPNGHLVAKRVRDLLPLKLSANLGRDDYKETSTSTVTSGTTRGVSMKHGDADADASPGNEENGEYPELYTVLRASFLRAFYIMDRDLKLHRNIDCAFSGTTAVTVIKQGQNLIIGNLGDSRAVLGTRDEDNQLVALQLTVDLKPSIPSEAERIRQRRGRVFSLPDEPDVARVWLPTFNSPGLAMARSFGDFCLKNYGVISMPDVSYHLITEKDEFIVLATDGVWDVLSNAEVVSIISKAPSQASAARFLVESAHRAWRTRYPTSKIDDCAAICLFLNTEATSTSSTSGTKDLANDVGLSSSKHLLTVKSSTGVPANLVTALVTDNDWSDLDGVSSPVTLPTLPKPTSVTKESIKD
ncbi:probable protein phosphatase 2C 38 [Phragmites australis]|uniref:probable protein phosphatase 2C 38 n=1 Tax=Phragmites australis TaxID=29695 RepID=UPI002D797A67|nr:probable protein phosphatase 2C 38 [Phragmites australis]